MNNLCMKENDESEHNYVLMNDNFETNIPVRNQNYPQYFYFVLLKEIIILNNPRHKGKKFTEHVISLFCFEVSMWK